MTLNIYWTLFADDQINQPAEEVLSSEELEKYSQFKFEKRRGEWLRGRLVAKWLLQHSLPEFGNLLPRNISVRNDSLGAPFFSIHHEQRLPGCLSISHSRGLALCGLTFEPMLQIGFDLEIVEPRFPGLVDDFFTPEENKALRICPAEKYDQMVTLIWSAKEAMLKALGKGLQMDTRQVEVEIPIHSSPEGSESATQDWQLLQVRHPGTDSGSWRAQWQQIGQFILTSAMFSAQPRQDIRLVRV